ncbi:MAG: hypothetical protein CMQ19_00530 [Gammaproteobacteria bacterium]|jgi:hypothetical protein|nr:hypothetical protein [Gammaproteobacteria bacterium]|tara:strand:+ start:237 stop:566 length:330 start_codon:yes stop_codon:yes gene_type:complete
MKTITLRKTEMPINHLDPASEMIAFSWVEEIKRLLVTPKNPEQSTDYEEMLEVMPVYNKFKAYKQPEIGDGSLELEDAEFKLVMDRLTSAKFRVNAPEVFEMIETIKAS